MTKATIKRLDSALANHGLGVEIYNLSRKSLSIAPIKRVSESTWREARDVVYGMLEAFLADCKPEQKQWFNETFEFRKELRWVSRNS